MKPLKVLIVEDELVTAASIQHALEKEGHRVTDLAINQEQVAASLQRERPDVILMDIILENSDKNGIEIAAMIQREHAIPLIYLTAQSDSISTMAARSTRPAAYLLKPFRHRELAIQIELAYNNYLEALASQSTITDSESFFLPVEKGKGYLKIAKKEVQYIRADSSYVEIYLEGQDEKQVFSMNLGYLEQFFPTPQFYRLGRSLLINLQFVKQINRGELWVEGRSKPIEFPELHYGDLLKKFKVIKTPGKKP